MTPRICHKTSRKPLNNRGRRSNGQRSVHAPGYRLIFAGLRRLAGLRPLCCHRSMHLSRFAWLHCSHIFSCSAANTEESAAAALTFKLSLLAVLPDYLKVLALRGPL